MRVVVREDLAQEFVDQAYERLNERPHEPEEFSAGITTLISCLRKAWYRRHGMSGQMNRSGKLTVMRGTAYHAILPPRDEDREVGFRKHVETGDVTGYADWVTVEVVDGVKQVLIIDELKTTAGSSKKPVAELYVDQIAGNCWLAGTTRARLYVYYMLGSWRPPVPELLCFEYEFEQNEIDSWGEELTRRLGELRKDEPPSLDEHYKWECKYASGCEFFNSGVCPGGGGRAFTWFGNELEEMLEVN